jgi:hypothetical protein
MGEAVRRCEFGPASLTERELAAEWGCSPSHVHKNKYAGMIQLHQWLREGLPPALALKVASSDADWKDDCPQ